MVGGWDQKSWGRGWSCGCRVGGGGGVGVGGVGIGGLGLRG